MRYKERDKASATSIRFFFSFFFFLQLSESLQREAFHVEGENITWTSPVTLEQLLQAKKLYPDAKLVAGNTAVGTLTFCIEWLSNGRAYLPLNKSIRRSIYHPI